MEPPRPPHLQPLKDALPPLFLGTATFNTQYVDDPAALPARAIVRRALVDLDVRGFDTSPYYGPAELLLGDALAAAGVDRRRYFLATKAGRVHGAGFDYRPAAVQASVARSLVRLRTDYVDLVYAHDVEFVTPAEAVAAVRALRQLRTASGGNGGTGIVKYVGISGFPVDVLADLAGRILRETGEPVDAVLSYGHCTVQNTRLVAGSGGGGSGSNDLPAVARLHQAGVGVVLNASLLNMGLLTTRGVDNGPQAAWHPSPPELRAVCAQAARVCQAQAATSGSDGKIERIALRYALDLWARAGAAAGVGTTAAGSSGTSAAPATVGASVLGVTSVDELTETVLEWWNVLDGLGVPHRSPDGDGAATAVINSSSSSSKKTDSLRRMQQVKAFVQQTLWPVFGEWKDFAWASPPPGWVNELRPHEPARL
ncbi:L-galactose dehydrogenase [Niveomyces insectorum RCEF 264]|uniref:L-galactose dehydrogenase n=1 Tax=Niveomyces insectorum RCEF 264 TaxID=1081102 RepID=A0A167XZT1_9HYPO|nr:L-galactose dehydrogenase [Niveomyces insectorum RCEF 264]